ncbi:MAG: peptidylprolyl isomerase [Nitrosomonas sp.]|nr:peptidylprolyl isomerase [Nitrosomonas sp.]MDP1951592.1 peptidylprolyl isomerase [Nitrosomonas sp.]
MPINIFSIIFIILIMLVTGIVNADESSSDKGISSVDYIVAVVNEEVITRNELNEVIAETTQQLLQKGVQPPDKEAMETQILETIIVKRIQLQRAKEIGLTINESELDETIRRIAEENKLSVQAFYSALEKDGINFTRFRNDIRDEVILVRLKEREVSNQVNVTEGEVDNFLRTQQTSSVGNKEYLIAHILVVLPEHSDALQIEEKRKRAEMALAKLRDNVEFAQVAAEYSDAEDNMKGGVLDWRPVTQMGPRFAEILTAMQPGELSPVIQSPIGFHILKLLDRRAQEVPVVIINQTHVRHILIKVNELTSENDAHQRIIQLKKRIDSGASFPETAKLHSDDSSASAGGELGWVSPGDTVPDFESAMNALLPGQISEPVQSPFGWHLIQVIERRTQNVSDERQRQVARQSIRARKADVVIQEWLHELRDEAYIEYRFEENKFD